MLINSATSTSTTAAYMPAGGRAWEICLVFVWKPGNCINRQVWMPNIIFEQ